MNILCLRISPCWPHLWLQQCFLFIAIFVNVQDALTLPCCLLSIVQLHYFHSEYKTTWGFIYCFCLHGSQCWLTVFINNILRVLIIMIPKFSNYRCVLDWDSNQYEYWNLPLDVHRYTFSLWSCYWCWLDVITTLLKSQLCLGLQYWVKSHWSLVPLPAILVDLHPPWPIWVFSHALLTLILLQSLSDRDIVNEGLCFVSLWVHGGDIF